MAVLRLDFVAGQQFSQTEIGLAQQSAFHRIGWLLIHMQRLLHVQEKKLCWCHWKQLKPLPLPEKHVCKPLTL